jgi:pimeloyl-ACP methyl ester carboxylesterase
MSESPADASPAGAPAAAPAGPVPEEGPAAAAREAGGAARTAPAEVAPAAPLPARRRVALADGCTIACLDEGAGPPVLLLHGLPTSAQLWRKVIARLAPAHRCIAPDLLGFGESEGPSTSDLTHAGHAARALALLDALGVTGEFALVGHDWGGVIAQTLAARAPERIASLVLVDSPAAGYDPDAVVRRIVAAARRPFVWDLAADTGLLRWFAKSAHGMRAGAFRADSLEEAALDDYMAPMHRDTPPAYRAARELHRRAIVAGFDDLDPALDETVLALRRFERPTLVVWGCDDPYVSVSFGKTLADEIPGCVGFELLPFCGHWVPEERPAELAALITGHLDGGRRAAAVADALLATVASRSGEAAAPIGPPPASGEVPASEGGAGGPPASGSAASASDAASAAASEPGPPALEAALEGAPAPPAPSSTDPAE